MKTSTIIFIIALLSSTITKSDSPAPVQGVFFQPNNIHTVFSTDGIFNYDKFTFNPPQPGLIWPAISPAYRTIGYATGFWIGAKVGVQKELRLAACMFGSHYTPGNIPVIGQPPPASVCSDPGWKGYLVNLTDQTLVNGGVRYKLSGGIQYTFNYESWANWPVAKGAPYVEVNNIPGYQPGWNSDRPGIGHTTARPDEILFMVYMDYTNCTNNLHASGTCLPGGTLPLGVEIHQISFAFNQPAFQNIYFVKWRIINKSSLTWDSTFVSIADDYVIGSENDDAAGCDSTQDIGIVYNMDNFDPVFGTPPPAIGYKLLQGPLKYTGNNNDTAKLPYGNFVGYKLLGMTSYNVFKANGDSCTGDPYFARHAYNFMRGKDGCGRPIINPITGKATNYWNHRDYCYLSGWSDSIHVNGKQLISSGPFVMVSGSEQYILTALVIGKGANNFQSACIVLNVATLAKLFFEESFGGLPIGIQPISSEVPDRFMLYQNYPNPFNPATKIRFNIPLLRGVDAEDRWGVLTKLIIYDILGREIAALVNEELNPGTYEVEWSAENYPSGVYFYTLSSGNYFDSKKMILLK